MEFLKGVLIIWMIRLRLHKIPVAQLYKDYLFGQASLRHLGQLLRPDQLGEFVEHHKAMRQQFEESDDIGLTRLDEMSQVFQDLVRGSPFLQAAIEAQGGMLLETEDRRRVFFALNQLDRLIESGQLEQTVRRTKKQNVVRRID
jgi:hypothetical protein